MNLYSYANSDSVNMVDSTGMAEEEMETVVVEGNRDNNDNYPDSPSSPGGVSFVDSNRGAETNPFGNTPKSMGAEFNIRDMITDDFCIKGELVICIGPGSIKQVGAKLAGKLITKSSLKRLKRLIKNLSDNSRQSTGLSQEKTDQLRRIVEKAGGTLRNDGVSGVRGSSAGRPHVQTEGIGNRIDSRHIWIEKGVQ